MLDFYIGQKVVCIDASDFNKNNPRFRGSLDGLAEGAIYTVRMARQISRWYIEKHPEYSGKIWVLVDEIRRDILDHEPEEVGYLSSRFRPLIHTDISVFTAMLAPSPTHKARELVSLLALSQDETREGLPERAQHTNPTPDPGVV